MHNRIFIEEDKEFSLDEFAHLVSRAIQSVAAVDIDKNDVVYSRDDVYFTIVDCLGYLNERTPGRFKFDQTSFQNYLIHYVPDGTLKRKASRSLDVSKVNSALQIKELSGKLPVWAEKDEALMTLIREREGAPKAAPTLVQKSVESKVEVDNQIEKLANDAVKEYKDVGEIPLTVTSNMEVLKRFYEILKTEETDV